MQLNASPTNPPPGTQHPIPASRATLFRKPALEPPALEPPALEPPALEPPALEPPAPGAARLRTPVERTHHRETYRTLSRRGRRHLHHLRRGTSPHHRPRLRGGAPGRHRLLHRPDLQRRRAPRGPVLRPPREEHPA